MLCPLYRGETDSIGTVIYYGAFVPTNLVFVISCIYSFRILPAPRWVKLVAVTATVHVLSWCALNLYGAMSGGRFYLGLGYLLWLAAYLLCALALMRRRIQPNQALQTTPMTRSDYEKTIELGHPQRGV